MSFEIPQNLMLMTGGAFLVGWLLSSISWALKSKIRAKKRDPRDDRIRSLEAENPTGPAITHTHKLAI